MYSYVYGLTSLPSEMSDEAPGWRRYSEGRREVPQINGSSGAFIAVIVCLVLVIIVANTAIFFLHRDQRVFDAEQARYPKRKHPQNSSVSNSSGSRKPWTSRMMAFFRRTDTAGSGRTQTKRNQGGSHGWIQAGSTGDWESDVGMSLANPSVLQEVDVTSAGPSSLQGTRFIKTPSPISRTTSDSVSSVRFDPNGIRGLSYPEMLPPPHSSLPNIHSQLSSRSTSPQSSRFNDFNLGALAHDSIPNGIQFGNDSREYVASSGMVMRTLPGGTKFVEGL